MRPRLFFKYFGELVVIRWVAWFSPSDGICLTPLTEYWLGSWTFTRPLCAVAVDVLGDRKNCWFSQRVAARRLDMSPEFSELVRRASLSPVGLEPREEEVRYELLCALERSKRFEISKKRQS